MSNDPIKITIRGLEGFANAVKFVRLKLDLSEPEMAREMKVCPASIKRWESGARPSTMAQFHFASFCAKNGIAIVYSSNFEYEVKIKKDDDQS